MKTKHVFVTVSILNLFLFLYFVLSGHYPWILVGIQITSIIALVVSQVPLNKLANTVRLHLPEVEIVAALVVVSLFVRMYRIDQVTPGMWGDEITVGRMALDLQKAPGFVPFVPTNYGHPTPLLYFSSIDMSLLGRTPLSLRLVSILFGTLAVLLFYILLRQKFSVPLSSIGSILFSFAYGNMVVSRLAYEQTASLFFQILCYLLLYLYWKRDKAQYLLLLGCAVGFGLWTYLAFRLIALGVIVFAAILVLQKYGRKEFALNIAYCLFGIFVSTVLLSSYALRHPSELLARTNSVSVFTQNLPLMEKVKELGGSTVRTVAVFFLKGDPNPRQNPSLSPYFDIATIALFFAGSFWLIRRNSKFLCVGALLFTPLLLNDILSTEFVPEFHYYGSGHPNALRIAGLLPVVYVLVTFAFQSITNRVAKVKPQISQWAICCLIAAPVVVLNWQAYFDQPFNEFIYTTNGVREYDATQAINSLGNGHYLISPSIRSDIRYQFFMNPSIEAADFVPNTSTSSSLNLRSGETVIFDPRQNLELAKSLIQELKSQNTTFKGAFIRNTNGEIEVIVFREL